jgi:hypothetical protein
VEYRGIATGVLCTFPARRRNVQEEDTAPRDTFAST